MSEHSIQHKPDNIEQEDWDEVASPVLSDDMLARMQPVRTTHPDMPARVRGSQKAPVKVPVAIRLSPEIVTFFRSQGKGWQTRINDVLSEYVESHESS